MLPTPKNYSIYPAVVRADEITQMTITPNEKAFIMNDGAEYRLTVISVNGDETCYYTPSTQRYVTVAARDGVLRFEYTFPDEQPHLIILEKDEVKLQEFEVYSLKPDLYGLRPLKGDLHSHSYRSDGKRDPSALAGHYREQGYEFFALTDHNRYYPGGEIDETFAGVNTGLCRVPGEEIHAPGSVIHIVHAGGDHSVAEQYVNDREKYNADIAEYLKKVPADLPEAYHERYAKAMWATDRIHEAGGLAIFPHPFWRPGKSRVYNVQEALARRLLLSGMFDAYEVLGGMRQDGNNRSVALWNETRIAGNDIPVVGSSDVHGLEGSTTFSYIFTLCFAEENAPEAIVNAVRGGLSVAVEATGNDYARQNRCYGSLRLVSYAHFLLQNYYPVLQRMCQGAGVAMREFAMGNADAALIELNTAQTDRYRRLFFGLEEAAAPAKPVRDFEDKWREVHLQGPLTCGSSIDAPPITRKI